VSSISKLINASKALVNHWLAAARIMSDGGGEHWSMFGNMGGIQAMGIVNALKTGDVRLDMIIAMLIPVMMSLAMGFVAKLSAVFNMEALEEWWRRGRHKYQRFIVYRAQRNSWGGSTNLDSDSKNTVLLKAIQLYLHHKGNLELPIANLNLTSMEDTTSGGYYNSYDDDDDGAAKTFAGTLSKLKIVKKLPDNKWHRLGMFGKPAAMVELFITDNEQTIAGKEGDGKANCVTTFQFVSSGPTAIDSLIDTAYQWYMEELRKMEDNSRYLYELKAIKKTGGTDSEENADEAPIVYSRYKLSDEKTFQSLFFRQKDSLLNMIDHFQAKSGKYAISGYPHKLGILLHGPPGSLVQYMGRVYCAPLSHIFTNSELIETFFHQVLGKPP
jgi:mitochondrial chaperone BCS1